MWNNHVNLCGRLTADPELKTVNEKPVANFAIAIQRLAKDKDAVDFISCVAWHQSARYLCDFGHKGDSLSLSGTLRSRSYENSEGRKVYVTEVITDSLHLFPKKEKTAEAV
jgi:single-strand DNA-binding protein